MGKSFRWPLKWGPPRMPGCSVMLLMFALLWPATAHAQQADPNALREKFEHLVELIGAGHAIETMCPGYEVIPRLEAAVFTLGVISRRADIEGDVAIRLALSLAEMGVRYNAKGDEKGFCARILADFGPGSSNPTVQRKKRSSRR